MCILYTSEPETVTFLHKNRGYIIKVFKSQTSKGWQWYTLGKEGEKPTKSQALTEARLYILNA